jgi:hypothetical protein
VIVPEDGSSSSGKDMCVPPSMELKVHDRLHKSASIYPNLNACSRISILLLTSHLLLRRSSDLFPWCFGTKCLSEKEIKERGHLNDVSVDGRLI